MDHKAKYTMGRHGEKMNDITLFLLAPGLIIAIETFRLIVFSDVSGGDSTLLLFAVTSFSTSAWLAHRKSGYIQRSRPVRLLCACCLLLLFWIGQWLVTTGFLFVGLVLLVIRSGGRF